MKDLVETNVRQRGIGNPNPIKLGRCIKELEILYGIEHGGDRKSSSNNYNLKTQKQLADEMGISIPTLQNYKLLADMIPELEDLIYTGIVTKNTALAMTKIHNFVH